MKTRDFWLAAILATACAATAVPAAAAGKVYRWVDEHGVVHYGDAIPPEYSKERHEVLDGRGTRVTVHGEKPEPDAPARDNRDRALLATYGSVAEIESVRDRRIGYLDDQNEVALDRLQSLRARREALADNPAAINELATVEQRIREYVYEISRRNAEIERIRDQFQGDIRRFEELRGAEGSAEDQSEESAARAEATPPER
ncbi:MAG TPA: DUF4124 domain-containing protein [Gammaproteobacteria bacterium]|nr:DUF4124 domain-containing protein [Gammaproteobacteria bacterium]